MHLRALAFCVLAVIALPSSTRAAAAYTWAHSYGDDASQVLNAVSTDPAGNVLICGAFYSTITIASTLTSAGEQDGFVAKLDANGNALWNRKIGSVTYDDIAWDVTSDKDGNVIAGGTMNPLFGVKLGIVKYDPNGTQLWVKTYGPTSTYNMARFVSTDLAGNIIVAGAFTGIIDFGGGALEGPDFGNYAMFLLKLDPDGNHIWSKAFTWHDGTTALGGLETDAMGNIFLHGQFPGSINFNGGSAFDPAAMTSNGATDLFLVKFGPDARVLWKNHYGTTAADNALCLAVTPDGRAAIAQNLDHAVDFGGGVLTPTGTPQPAVAQFTANGSHVWSKTFTATTSALAYGITIAENKDVVLTVHGTGSINFGGGPVAATGSVYNQFVARFNAAGTHRWSFAFGGDGNVYGLPAVSRGGGVVVAGYTDGAANPGGGALPYEGENDVFVARFGETLTGVGTSSMMANLYQNVPNPFNPTTSIPYMLEAPAHVKIGIYDVSGSRIAVLNEGKQTPGVHAAIWNGRDQSGRAVPSGVYFYRFEGMSDVTGSRKMVLLK